MSKRFFCIPSMCVHFLYIIPFIINKVWEWRVHQAHLMGRGLKLKLNCMSHGKYRASQMQDELFIFWFLWRDVFPSLPCVKLLHALEDSAIVFNNPWCVFQGSRTFIPLQHSLLKHTWENCENGRGQGGSQCGKENRLKLRTHWTLLLGFKYQNWCFSHYFCNWGYVSEEQKCQCSFHNLISFQLFLVIAFSFSTYETNLLISWYTIYNIVAIIHDTCPGHQYSHNFTIRPQRCMCRKHITKTVPWWG